MALNAHKMEESINVLNDTHALHSDQNNSVDNNKVGSQGFLLYNNFIDVHRST